VRGNARVILDHADDLPPWFARRLTHATDPRIAQPLKTTAQNIHAAEEPISEGAIDDD
jgi:hypothetical protein